MVEYLTLESFKEKVFDYENNQEWKFKGSEPCLIDFYADWCGPCKMIAPILDELSSEYEGKVKIYKINTEKEQELAGMFGIRSIPSLLFVPLNEEPQMANGAMGKSGFKEAFKEILKVEL
ncbi:MAG: thioredoxin [Bdellovibrio sp. CG12_big_fil_rev_8_21_14_0_65_39_13]|nr:MAG: thioredoxin [Bdellovibrio sp. CG22_combo_CG10-13_8_21_14_all_39_27]PIQ59736.1 MAG: thioredoxin [Bdellovibrio sp. CG12_big_fil_rev_8_21_14_0_65_39_13]PIR36234.1 MAG: thioredoxin [Bdellovibrio sp. CG11_big_fil_rev_8_21_14_0_20_39_38]